MSLNPKPETRFQALLGWVIRGFRICGAGGFYVEGSVECRSVVMVLMYFEPGRGSLTVDSARANDLPSRDSCLQDVWSSSYYEPAVRRTVIL